VGKDKKERRRGLREEKTWRGGKLKRRERLEEKKA